MTNITIQKKNEIYLKVEAEPYIHQELSEYFTFEVPDIEFIDEIADLTIMVNDEDGTVELIMVDNSEHRLADIINDDEIGWEIEYEIRDCVTDYLKINVEDKFGVVCHPNIIFQSRNI